MWQPDRYFRGGQALLRARFATGTDDPELYRGERFGNITYVIPVAPDTYAVTLRFSEAWFGPGKPAGGGAGSRRFDIVANSQFLVRNFEVFKEAGGTDRAIDKTFHKLQPNAQGKLVISRTLSGKGIDQKFALLPDDTTLAADGADTTRVVLRVTDEFDAIRPFAADAIRFELTGPATIIGDSPFALIGGTGAIWIRAGEQPGKVRLTAHHPYLGAQHIEFDIQPAPPETA